MKCDKKDCLYYSKIMDSCVDVEKYSKCVKNNFSLYTKYKEAVNSESSILAEIRAMQGYEPDYGETMTTQQDGRWVEREEVLKIASKYFIADGWRDVKKELPKLRRRVCIYIHNALNAEKNFMMIL